MGKGKLKNILKKAAVLVGKTAGGKNMVGETLHGVLDLLPVPNQPIGRLVEAVLAGMMQKYMLEKYLQLEMVLHLQLLY